MRRISDRAARRSTASLARRFARSRDGATAVEFGLILIPFVGLLAATFDTGIGYLTERNLDAATQNAARKVRTGAVQSAGIANAKAFTNGYLCGSNGLLDSMIDCSKVIIDVRTSSNLTGNDMSSSFYKSPSNQFCLGAPNAITVVRVAYPMPWYIPVITFGGIAQTAGLVNDVPKDPGWKLLLVSAAVVRSEPYPAAGYATYKSNNGC